MRPLNCVLWTSQSIAERRWTSAAATSEIDNAAAHGARVAAAVSRGGLHRWDSAAQQQPSRFTPHWFPAAPGSVKPTVQVQPRGFSAAQPLYFISGHLLHALQ